MKIEPPALPPPIVDVNDEQDGIAQIESTWDTLARAIAKEDYNGDDRVRVRWVRYSLIRWHCGRPMRRAVVEHQDKKVTFGWQRSIGAYVACGRCGFFDWII